MKNTRITLGLIGLSLAILAWPVDTIAKPKKPGGGSCDSTGTERRVGKDEAGNKLDCKWDTCTVTECTTSGGKVGNCTKKTTYSNPRDCKEASVKAPGISLPKLDPKRALDYRTR